MCEKISKGEIREIIVCGVQSGQAVISVSCSRHCGDGLSKFQHSHHEFSQISFSKRGGQCHITLLGDKRVPQHVVDEKHQQSCFVCCQSQYCGPDGTGMYISLFAVFYSSMDHLFVCHGNVTKHAWFTVALVFRSPLVSDQPSNSNKKRKDAIFTFFCILLN